MNSAVTYAHEEDYRSSDPVNALTVDVEDYFQVSAFENSVHKDRWNEFPSRIEKSMARILEIFDDLDVKATFFTLGWVAERYPQIVREIALAGHELASHGYQHIRVIEQTPDQFREDVTRTKAILEDITGAPVSGYRAASFSIGANNLWALDVLEESGYRYSSSIYPINHDLYGMPEAPRFPFRLRTSGLLEIPVTTVTIMRHRFPCGGGGYFRLYPYYLSRWALRRVNHHDRQPSVFYFHPWEIDPDQPRLTGIGVKTRFRHYLNLGRTEKRLNRLLSDFSWNRMDKIFLTN